MIESIRPEAQPVNLGSLSVGKAGGDSVKGEHGENCG